MWPILRRGKSTRGFERTCSWDPSKCCHLFFLCPTIWADNGRRRGNSDSVTGTGIGYRLGLGFRVRVRVRALVMATGMVVARASKLTCMMPESLCVTGAVDEAVASVAGTTSESP